MHLSKLTVPHLISLLTRRLCGTLNKDESKQILVVRFFLSTTTDTVLVSVAKM